LKDVLSLDRHGPSVASCIDTNPRNFASSVPLNREDPSTQIQSFTFSPNQRFLVTFEELADRKYSNKQISLSNLKIFEKSQSIYSLKQIVAAPCSDPRAHVVFLSNSRFLFVADNKV
jgi:hypothetical protein